MSRFTEEGLEALVTKGCPSCGSTTLKFQTYVDCGVPMMGAEPVGKLFWAYDGEKFVDGVFEIVCDKCAAVVFEDDVCPRCHAEGGLATALATENAYPALAACPSCDSEEVRLIGMVPAKTVYAGKRAEKARTSVEPHDPGFHGYRIDCKTCGTVATLDDRCPLCAAPGPLRPRPDIPQP